MNLYKVMILWVYSIIISFWSLFAQNSKRTTNHPIILIDSVAHSINSWDRIQDTALNDINPNQGQYASEYRITNAFDAIRIQIAPYIQWTIYIGLSLAVIGIVYNWFLMVTKPAGTDGDTSKVKERLIKIIKGVFLLTGFYVIIQFILAIIGYILQ